MRLLYPEYLEEAILFATEKHKGQKRKNGKDYISHPLSVLSILQRHDFDKDILASAILHDVLEDSDTTPKEIKTLFGERVCFMVTGLSKLKKRTVKAKQVGGFRLDYRSVRFNLYLKTLSNNALVETGIIAVKMADQIDNLTDIAAVSVIKQAEKKQQVKLYFMPVYRAILERPDFPETEKNRYEKLYQKLEDLTS